MNFKNIEKLIEEKYIRKQTHLEFPLVIYNYTEKAQYDKMWNEETMSCRGLICDDENNIISRPFKKFFNLSELEKIPSVSYRAFEKLDGSLGISYSFNGEIYLATRGSFDSEQAIKGTEILKDYGKDWYNQKYTYLFEIIYPQNRIVVDYGMTEDIIILAVIETETGQEVEVDTPFKKAEECKVDINNLESKENKEGYVLKFDDGTMAKVKFDEYVRLHRLVTQVTARSIWDLLRNKQPIDELLERVPDEFYQWVKDTKLKLELQYSDIEAQSLQTLDNIKSLPTRKDQALAVKDFKYKGIVFALLDGKPVDELIWKLLRPKHELPFKKEI